MPRNDVPTNDELRGWIGRDLVDRDGSKVGTVGDVYFDEQTGQPEWLTVTTGLFGRKVSFVPLEGIRSGSEALLSPWTIDHIREAPRCEPDGRLSDEEEADLYRHYGMGDAPADEERPRDERREDGAGEGAGDEVVAQAQVVPEERIRVERATIADGELVEADLRRERTGVEGDEPHGMRPF